jgi:hypothetical protein
MKLARARSVVGDALAKEKEEKLCSSLSLCVCLSLSDSRAHKQRMASSLLTLANVYMTAAAVLKRVSLAVYIFSKLPFFLSSPSELARAAGAPFAGTMGINYFVMRLYSKQDIITPFCAPLSLNSSVSGRAEMTLFLKRSPTRSLMYNKY